jgi:regulation of enolase protein 1 (concanavalin A-like superfamily)
MHWLNEPPCWREEPNLLQVKTGERTDFWRETSCGLICDDGHLHYERLCGDFSSEVTFEGDYHALYDQAGLMLRNDERHWVKAGVEYLDSRLVLGSVVTRDYSDWSTTRALNIPNPIRLRLTRRVTPIRIEWSPVGRDPDSYELLRLAYLPLSEPADVGVMCCSPRGSGFMVRFWDRKTIPETARHITP